MANSTIYEIFKKGSTTYFYSSMFFPKDVRDDVFVLYSFVRRADDFVDKVEQDKNGYFKFKQSFYNSLETKKSADEIVVDSFIELFLRRSFDIKWIDSFFASMEMDLEHRTYADIDETERYIYGSADVIGLMMARILNLHDNAYHYAQYLGKAFQYINFIRDIAEDIKLNRSYFPQDELRTFGLKTLDYDEIKNKSEDFKSFMRFQIDRYHKWLHEAEKGFYFIPRRYLIPIKTASDMYQWTAKTIMKDPMIVYRSKVKPCVRRIIFSIIYNMIFG